MYRAPPPRGGPGAVDHPTGGHDDHANALALAAVLAMRTRRRLPAGFFERPILTDIIPGMPARPLPSPSGGIRRRGTCCEQLSSARVSSRCATLPADGAALRRGDGSLGVADVADGRDRAAGLLRDLDLCAELISRVLVEVDSILAAPARQS